MLGSLRQKCGGVVTGFYGGSVGHEDGNRLRHTARDGTRAPSIEVKFETLRFGC